jgi:predicted ATP-grasp superfamily ATP-dependent carboligase
LSGRALAVAAWRAGYAPLVADLFGDEDMRAVACASIKTGGDLATGLDETALLDSLTRLAAGRDCEGLVCGSGFEDRPGALARLAQHWPLLGNDAATVARAKDPFAFATLCGDLGIPHPAVRATRPADTRNWLRKRMGGSGGTHVQAASHEPESLEPTYYQRRVAGRAVSALFLANGEEARLVGFSAQWSSPTRAQPARYGGAVRPAGIDHRLKKELGRVLGPLSRALGLRGLNSADFLVGDQDFWLIEINPRPGATLDLFDASPAPLFDLHADACRGTLPARAPRLPGAAAVAIVYATRLIPEMPALDWPDWCADLQVAGTSLRVGEPICSVRANASSSARAKALAEARGLAILARTQGERR